MTQGGAKFLSLAPGSGPGQDYVALDCSHSGTENCQCHEKQVWMRSKWRPQNWQNWPQIRTVLISVTVGIIVTWFVVYLILHFYYESL